jgi:anti-sigma factor RsiW
MLERLFRRQPHPSEDDLSAFVDAELSAGRQRAYEAHLEGCASCAETVAGLLEVKSTLARLPSASPPRSFELSRAAAGVEGQAPRPRTSPFVFAPAVALTLFIALIGLDLAGTVQTTSREASTAGAAADSTLRKSLEASPPAADAPAGARPASAEERGAESAAPMVASTQAGASDAAAPPVVPAGGAPDGDAYAAPLATAEDGGGLGLLRALQIGSGLAFIGSLLLVLRARSQRKVPDVSK